MSLLIVFGIYFTLKSGFYFPTAIKKTVKDTLFSLKAGKKDGISPFAAVATALGGTVGIGSIVGVSYALSVGGAGSIFWMWVCSFFGMGLKYAEVKIALNKRTVTPEGSLGGAPFRLKGLGFKKLAVIFCICCVLTSFGTGNLTQTGTISSFLDFLGVPKIFCALICCAVIAFAVFGGRKRIANINSFIIPAASAVYLLVCVCIIILNRAGIGYAFSEIFKNAFGISAVTGGFSGALLAHVLREGFVRSMFSNEAGMGSSPLAHATAEGNVNVQAEWGIFEIFFDTFVVSTLTAVCLLCGGFDDVMIMFRHTFGDIGIWLFGILSAVFAFASVISWCYYAECCISFISPKSNIPSIIYRVFFSLSAILGTYISGELIWEISDILNALMMFPNLFLLFKCRKEIERMT